MKVGVIMSALREKKRIVPAIKQFDGFPIEVVVACSAKSWHGDEEGDDTASLAAMTGATVRRFAWKDEKDQKNWQMDKLSDKDWVLMFAPDMFMEHQSIVNLLKYLETGKERGYGCDMFTYWKDYNHECLPHSPFYTLAFRPTERFEFGSRMKNYTHFPLLQNVTMHHLSFVRTDEEMKLKLKTWTHAPAVRAEWYNDWKNNIVSGIESRADMRGIKDCYLPDEIRKLCE